MEQKTYLSQFQVRLLEIILSEPYLVKNYYWTGGTVLTEFYLHHRESYDLDLFTEKAEVHLPSVMKFSRKAGQKLGAKKITSGRFLGLYSFTFILPDDSELKIDFNYYPFPRVEVGKKYKTLNVDSLIDIAVNKVHTLFMRPRFRDYIDLYFILNGQNELSLEKLISLADVKFDWHIDPLQLGENLTRIVAPTTLKNEPKMLVPFDRKQMEKWYLNLASQLKKDILE